MGLGVAGDGRLRAVCLLHSTKKKRLEKRRQPVVASYARNKTAPAPQTWPLRAVSGAGRQPLTCERQPCTDAALHRCRDDAEWRRPRRSQLLLSAVGVLVVKSGDSCALYQNDTIRIASESLLLAFQPERKQLSEHPAGSSALPHCSSNEMMNDNTVFSTLCLP